MAAPLIMNAGVMAEPVMTDPRTTDPRKTDARTADRARRIRAKNRALLLVLVGLVALFYAITMARMGG
jgi:hypothetical protein